MKRLIIGAPGLFASGFEPLGEAWQTVVARSRIFGLSAEPGGMEELGWLGLPPSSAFIAQGPLTAAAFHIWPPERSVVFEATFLGLDASDQITPIDVSHEESEHFFGLLKPLERRNWTFARGEGSTHLLVREKGSIDVHCPMPSEIEKETWEPSWPQGDDEDVLRTIILDSREQFEGADFNRRREGEGLPRIGFVWLWGPGLAGTLPNLGVTRGELVRYYSASRRLKGAARLAGYWHGELNQTFEMQLRDAAKAAEPAVAVHPVTDPEQAEKFGAEIQQFVFDPLVLRKSAGELRLTIIDPGKNGLGMNFDSRRVEPNGLPFDQRVLDDERLRSFPLHESILRALSY